MSLLGIIEGFGDWMDNNQSVVNLAGNLGSLYGAYLQSKGIKEGTEEYNAAITALAQENNDLQREMYYDSRGGGPNASAFLPLHMKNEDGVSYEEQLGKDLWDTYYASRNNTDGLNFGETTRQFFMDNEANGYKGAFGLGNQFIEDIYSGDLAGDRQALVDNTYDAAFANMADQFGQAQGVLDAYEGSERDLNQQASKARKAAINKGLGDRIKEIQFQRNRRGLGGESSFSNALMQGATIGARQQAALGDIQDERNTNSIYMPQRVRQADRATDFRAQIEDTRAGSTMQGFDTDRALRTNMLDAPANRAQQAYDFGMMPQNNQYRSFDDLSRRLDFFRIGTGNPPATSTPNIQPTLGGDSALGAGISAGGEYFGGWGGWDDDDDNGGGNG